MSDEPESAVLRYLRRLDEGQRAIKAGLREIKERLGGLDGQCGGIIGQYGSLSRRLDRVAYDVE